MDKGGWGGGKWARGVVFYIKQLVPDVSPLSLLMHPLCLLECAAAKHQLCSASALAHSSLLTPSHLLCCLPALVGGQWSGSMQEKTRSVALPECAWWLLLGSKCRCNAYSACGRISQVDLFGMSLTKWFFKLMTFREFFLYWFFCRVTSEQWNLCFYREFQGLCLGA